MKQDGIRMGVAMAVVGTVIGLLALVVFVRHMSGASLPLVTDDRTAFVMLAVIGLVMCAFGIQVMLRSTGWLSPGTFIGAIIGILILITFVMALLGRPMFLLGDYRTGFIALGLAMAVKWGVSTGSLIYSLIRS